MIVTAQEAPQKRERTAVMVPLTEDINPLSGAILKRKFAEAVEAMPM